MTMLTAFPVDPLPTDPAERVRATRTGLSRVVYSPSGRLVATADVRMNVVVRREDDIVYSANFESLDEKIRPTDRVRGLGFTADERELWIAASDSIRVVRLSDGKEIMAYTPPRSFGFLVISPIALAVDENGQVAAAFDDGSLATWYSSREKEVRWKDNDSPRTLGFARDGRMLVGTDSFTLCAWETSTHRKTLRLSLDDRAYGAAVSSHSDYVATRHLSHTKLWRLDEGVAVGSFPVEAGLPLVEFHPTQPWLALGSAHAVDLFHLDGQPVDHFPVEDLNVVSFAFAPKGDRLTVGCSDDSTREFFLR